MPLLPDELTDRDLVLRRWRTSMVDQMLDAVGRSIVELERWMPWARELPSRAQLEVVLRDNATSFESDAEWNYAIVESESDELVGSCGLHRFEEPTCPEIGYWIRSDRTRRGYATRAARQLVNAAFSHLGDADRLKIRMDRANAASAAVPARLGFTLDHEEDREIVTSGHTGKGYVWILERPTWTAARDSLTH